MSEATNTPAAAAKTRTQAFSRNFGDFAGKLTLSPSDELGKLGVKPITFDAANIPGFSTMPKGARVIMQRGIADQLTQVFASVLRGTKEEGEGTIPEALDEMNDVFTSIVEGTFSYGRAGTGAGRVQGVALTAALMVAAQYGLTTREEAIAHAHYLPIKEKLQGLLSQADTFSEQADAVVIPTLGENPTDEEKAAHEAAKKEADTHNANATALRSAYMALAKDEKVSALRNKWYPPKAKEPTTPAVTLASVFESLPAVPAAQ